MKDQAVKLRGDDVRLAKSVKKEMPECSTAKIIGACLFGWRYLSAEQKLASLNRNEQLARESAEVA